MRYFAQISYNGTNYCGWQLQPNAITVQEVITKAFNTILRKKTELTGAGRTDTGVHAEFFMLSFEIDTEIAESELLVKKLNSFLPNDIAVQKIFRVADDANSRFSAISRTYEYRITQVKNPFKTTLTYYFHSHLDIEAMNRACHKLFDYNDFTSFSKLHSGAKTNLCKISQAQWFERDNLLVFSITADRFLRNMVRAIVGTMIEVGKQKISIDDFCRIIEAKNRAKAGFSVPPQALFLVNIEYPKNITNS